MTNQDPTQPFILSEWLEALHRVFGFQAFRPHQEEIVRAIHGGRDVFAVMPTGGGKSLCYQLPARVLPGTTLVISPLIALMKDQVDAAVKIGLRASFLNSSQTESERTEVVRSPAKRNPGSPLCGAGTIGPGRFSASDQRGETQSDGHR